MGGAAERRNGAGGAVKKIKVLVIDDSAIVRKTMQDILSSDPDIEVMACALDPIIASQKMRNQVPDVITLDVEMPRMDGLTFLKKLMSQHPIPVVMCSSFTERGSEIAFKALEYGAVDVIAKPRIGTREFLEESRVRICDAVKAASMVRPKQRREPIRDIPPKLTADAVLPKPGRRAFSATTDRIVLVGASTGGTEAIREFLEFMPATAPGTVIVQHMPEQFTRTFAQRLDSLCRVSVKEAEDGDAVLPGTVLIAPGNRHTLLRRAGSRYSVEVRGGPLVSRHRPSVDVLFRSGARAAGKNAVGVIMTGMGDDGAKGMKEMKEAGAFTIAQDEASCVVYGMPHEAAKLGGVDAILPLPRIAEEVLRICGAAQEPASV